MQEFVFSDNCGSCTYHIQTDFNIVC